MSRPNSHRIRLIRAALIFRDGNSCKICGSGSGGRDPDLCVREGEILDVDHIDNYPNNWDWDNLRLAHHSCNSKAYAEAARVGAKYIKESTTSRQVSVCDPAEESAPPLPTIEEQAYRTSSERRGDETRSGILKYLGKMAILVSRGERIHYKDIVQDAPGSINRDRPPSIVSVERWLKVFSGSEYPYRFDQYGYLYLEELPPRETNPRADGHQDSRDPLHEEIVKESHII